jgi:hypothetical protein
MATAQKANQAKKLTQTEKAQTVVRVAKTHITHDQVPYEPGEPIELTLGEAEGLDLVGALELDSAAA